MMSLLIISLSTWTLKVLRFMDFENECKISLFFCVSYKSDSSLRLYYSCYHRIKQIPLKCYYTLDYHLQFWCWLLKDIHYRHHWNSKYMRLHNWSLNNCKSLAVSINYLLRKTLPKPKMLDFSWPPRDTLINF